MARARCTFRQGDITKAVKAVAAAGLHVTAVRVDNAGVIEVVTGESAGQDSNALDQWLGKHARQAEGH